MKTKFPFMVAAAFMVLSFHVIPPSFAQVVSKDDAFYEVQQLINSRKFDEAVELLTRMTVPENRAGERYIWLSRAQLELGAGIAAEAAIARARSLNADYAVTAVPFAKALLVQGKYDEALGALRGVNIPKQLQGQSYTVSGDANFALKKYAAAKRDYHLSIKEDDSSFQPYLGLARLALRDSSLDEAEALALKAEHRDPVNTMVQYTLGIINRYSGNLDVAEHNFLNAVQAFPNNVMANIELASIRINQNRIADAEEYLDMVFSVSSNQPMAIYLTAVILATRGEYDEAELNLLRVPSLTSNYLPAIYVRGLVAYQLGKNDAAATALEQVLRVRPNNKAARMALAGTYANQQRPRAALRILQPLLELEEELDTAVLSMAAAASMAAGEVERGKIFYQKVSEMQATSESSSVTGATSKLAMAQFVTGNAEAAVATISSLSAGVGVELRELGVMASMQMRSADTAGAKKTIDRIIETAPSRALGYNMRGTLAYGEQDYAAAIIAYSEALSRNPIYYAALRNRALSYFRLGQFARAENDLKKLLAQQPNDARAKAILGKTLLAAGQAQESLGYFRDALRAVSGSIALNTDYAEALAKAGNTTRAIEQARDAARMGADRPEVLKRMGLLLLDLGQAEAAERPLSRHVAFFPNSGAAHLLQGRALLAMGLYTGAKTSFLRAGSATEEKPDGAILAWYLFAADALALRQELALKQLQVLEMSKRPEDISANIVGDILLHSGLSKRAETAYRSAIDRQQTAPLVIGLARALSAQSRGEAAIEVLERYVAENANDRFVRAELGSRYEASEKFAAAALHYEAILRTGIADAAAAARLASVYLRLNNNDSVRLVEQAFLISPDDPYILDVYGWVMLQAARDVNRATIALEKAVRRSPGNSVYKYHLGMAYLAANRKRDALTVLKQAVSLNSNFDGADEAQRQINLLDDLEF